MTRFIHFLAATAVVLVVCCRYCYGADRVVPQYIIDLDTPPHQRWGKIYTLLLQDKQYREVFISVMQSIQDDLVSSNCFDECINRLHDSFKKKFPDYYEELEGIYDIIKFLNITFPQFVASQLEYEINMLFIPDSSSDSSELTLKDKAHLRRRPLGCTSVLTCDAKKHVLHGRNLEWDDVGVLAPLVFIVNYTRNNKVIFQAHHIPGHLGVMSGVRLNGFSISLNARTVEYNPTLDQFLDCMDAVPLQPIMTGYRYYLENFEKFEDVADNITNTYYCCPRYTILGGLNGQGARYQHYFSDEYKNFTANYTPCVIPENLQCTDRSWLVAEANSDLDVPVSIDKRRGLVMDKLNEEGRAVGASVDGLYKAMTIPNVRLIDTVFTSIMSPENGDIKTIAFTCGSSDILRTHFHFLFVCIMLFFACIVVFSPLI